MLKAAVTACAFVALLATFAQPAASAPRPPVIPAVAQYIEMLPTSGGNAVPTGKGRTRLPSDVARELGSSPQDKLLRAVATSAAYGAPQHRLHVNKHVAVKVRHSARKTKPSAGVSRSALGASIDAVGADRSVVLSLGIALLAIAAAGAGAAAFGRRRHGR
jgi:hypothetical protein